MARARQSAIGVSAIGESAIGVSAVFITSVNFDIFLSFL
jgi:hypothetical protein